MANWNFIFDTQLPTEFPAQHPTQHPTQHSTLNSTPNSTLNSQLNTQLNSQLPKKNPAPDSKTQHPTQIPNSQLKTPNTQLQHPIPNSTLNSTPNTQVNTQFFTKTQKLNSKHPTQLNNSKKRVNLSIFLQHPKNGQKSANLFLSAKRLITVDWIFSFGKIQLRVATFEFHHRKSPKKFLDTSRRVQSWPKKRHFFAFFPQPSTTCQTWQLS